MPPPKADQYQDERSARAVWLWYVEERWKRRGAFLLFLIVWTALAGALIYHWGVLAGQLAGCLP